MNEKTRLKLLREKEIKERKTKGFEELKKELEEVLKYTAEEWIPKFCDALRDENPTISISEIKARILKDSLVSKIWAQGTIKNNWSDWMIDKQKSESGKLGAAASHSAHKNVGTNENHGQEANDEEDENKPAVSYTMDEYEETHPKTEESPFQSLGRINRAIATLWTALTNNKNMPTMEDDVKKDFIIPARDRAKDIVNGSSKIERDFLFNWITWLGLELADWKNIVANSDATAYDTRENKE